MCSFSKSFISTHQSM